VKAEAARIVWMVYRCARSSKNGMARELVAVVGDARALRALLPEVISTHYWAEKAVFAGGRVWELP
jgi:hypothetical protein